MKLGGEHLLLCPPGENGTEKAGPDGLLADLAKRCYRLKHHRMAYVICARNSAAISSKPGALGLIGEASAGSPCKS